MSCFYIKISAHYKVGTFSYIIYFHTYTLILNFDCLQKVPNDFILCLISWIFKCQTLIHVYNPVYKKAATNLILTVFQALKII